MPITKTITVYKASELTGKAKEKAIKFGQKINDSVFQPNELTNQMEEYLADKYGIVDCDLKWSLSCSQGDGVGIYGFPNINKLKEKDQWIKNRIEDFTRDLTIEVVKVDPHYDHWNSMRVDLIFYNSDGYDGGNPENNLQTYLQQKFQEASKDVANYGYAILDNERNNENIIDMLDANDYTFLENGELFLI